MTQTKRDISIAKSNLGRLTGGLHTDRPVMLSELDELGLLPDQTGHVNEVLVTDGTTASWQPFSTLGLQYLEHTYAEMLVLVNNKSLIKGNYYNITDRADLGIILQAVDIDKLSLKGTGLFLNPDYQDIGDYSGSGLLLPKGTNLGLWRASKEGGAANGDIFIFGGIAYQVLDTSSFDGSSPDSNPVGYNALNRDITNGYILEADDINYAFLSDSIIYRADKRSNIVQNNNAMSIFQWGRDNVYNNKILEGDYDCINNEGNISGNVVIRGSVISNENHLGTVSSCTFESYNGSITVNFDSGKDIRGSSILIDGNVVFDPTVVATKGTIDGKYSTFQASLSMSGGTNFVAGVLTIPSNLNYVGLFTLTGNTGQTITKIIHTPLQERFSFRCANGITQNFSHTAIGLAVASNLVSDSASSNAIVGRVKGWDEIEYKVSVDLNERMNITKLQ